MENKDITRMGFSDRAKSPSFREEIRSIRQKKLRKTVIKTAICAVILIAAVSVIIIAYLIPEMPVALAWATAAAVAAIPVFGIITIIQIFRVHIDYALMKDLDKEYCDGEIISRQEWEKESSDDHGCPYTITNHRVRIGLSDGRTKELITEEARALVRIAKDGDKVRYHPGFIYPVELFDKSNGNICVFCCAVNNAQQHNCEKCEKPMLI